MNANLTPVTLDLPDALLTATPEASRGEESATASSATA